MATNRPSMPFTNDNMATPNLFVGVGIVKCDRVAWPSGISHVFYFSVRASL